MIISFDPRQAEIAAERAFKEMAAIMSGEFTKAISEPVYSWPKGESPRDVVDTGRLRSSQQYSTQGFVAKYEWPVEYAAAVHNGYLTRGGTAMPARPWTTHALAKKDPAEITNKLVNAYL